MNRLNRMIIDVPRISGDTISYSYAVEGPWREAFRLDQEFCVEYGFDVSRVPSGVAIVPFLSNVLPMAWVYDAEIQVPVCDADFFRCIPEVERGYKEMYPTILFGGVLDVARVECNAGNREGTICLFSGGVDAFNTLIQHVKEDPTLLTLRGSDVALDDIAGWNNVERHLEEVSADFGVGRTSAASSFRQFLNEGVLCKKVSASGDNWWHGFQHGLGILGHAAPAAWVLGKSTVYIASSFTAEDRGKVTCASDPSIDNHVRFCGAHVVHDGYEFRRQDKVANIVRFSRSSGISVKLRVCWESAGGSNCCHCEKCLRTILAIYAEGADPRDFGFDYEDINSVGKWFRNTFSVSGTDERLLQRYLPIQETMRKNLTKNDIELGLRWFYEGDLHKLVHASLPKRALAKAACKVRSVLS